MKSNSSYKFKHEMRYIIIQAFLIVFAFHLLLVFLFSSAPATTSSSVKSNTKNLLIDLQDPDKANSAQAIEVENFLNRYAPSLIVRADNPYSIPVKSSSLRPNSVAGKLHVPKFQLYNSSLTAQPEKWNGLPENSHDIFTPPPSYLPNTSPVTTTAATELTLKYPRLRSNDKVVEISDFDLSEFSDLTPELIGEYLIYRNSSLDTSLRFATIKSSGNSSLDAAAIRYLLQRTKRNQDSALPLQATIEFTGGKE